MLAWVDLEAPLISRLLPHNSLFTLNVSKFLAGGLLFYFWSAFIWEIDLLFFLPSIPLSLQLPRSVLVWSGEREGRRGKEQMVPFLEEVQISQEVSVSPPPPSSPPQKFSKFFFFKRTLMMSSHDWPYEYSCFSSKKN